MSILFQLVLVWAVAFIFLKFFDVLSSGLISRWLNLRNITLKFGYISYYTTQFNDAVEAFARVHRHHLRIWFNCGTIFAFFGLLFSIVLLLSNAVALFAPPPRAATPLFQDLPRVPFHHRRPWWFPRPVWQLLSASDHHPAALFPLSGMRDMHASAMRWGVQSWYRRRPHHKPPPPPHRPPRDGKDCQYYHTEFQKEVGRVLSMPAWLSQQRKRHRRFSLRKPSSAPPPRRRLFAVDDAGPARDKPDVVSSAQAHASTFLTPLVPGVTVPAGDVWYMIAAVLFAAVVHELGHAVAAGAEDGQVSGMGAFIAVLLPGAYVRLHGIELMSARAQLRVYCAGAWHNLVTVMMGLLLLRLLPFFAMPLFSTGEGALIVAVPPVSPLYEHVVAGDVLLRLGPFDVRDGGPSFRAAVHHLVDSGESVGFCVSERVLRDAARQSGKCCDASGDEGSLSCFRFANSTSWRTCIDATVISSGLTCRSSVECALGGALNGAAGVGANKQGLWSGARRLLSEKEVGRDGRLTCVMPVLGDQQQLVDVSVRSVQQGSVVHFFYQGYGHILGQSVTVSSYIPRGWAQWSGWLLKFLAWWDVPNVVERLLQYVCSISLGLGILNMAPVLYLDGEASAGLFVRVLLPWLSQKRVLMVRAALLIMGSLLLAVTLLTGIWNIEPHGR